MKKVLSILLLLLYAITSFGFGVKQFNCCGQLKSVSFTVNQVNNEKYVKGYEKERCCENQFSNLKIEDTHLLSVQLSSAVKYLTKLFPATFDSYCHSSDFTIIKRVSFAHSTHEPALHGNIPIYIFNCTYRI